MIRRWRRRRAELDVNRVRTVVGVDPHREWTGIQPMELLGWGDQAYPGGPRQRLYRGAPWT